MLATIGPYINSIEHFLAHSPRLVKSLNIPQRDAKMTRLLDFDTYFELDYSRFDMTMSYDWMTNVELAIFSDLFPGDDHIYFREFMRMALTTTGISRSGMVYKIIGTRCSGDAHTSIANGLTNMFNLWLALGSVPSDDWLSYHEGDDTALACVASVADLVEANLGLVNCFGFKLKITRSSDISTIGFCGRFLASDLGKLVSYADPLRTLDKFHISLYPGDARSLALAKALSYHHTDGQTPIIGSLCRLVMRDLPMSVLKPKHLQRVLNERWNTRNTKISERRTDKVTADHFRVPFFVKTGITPAQQQAIEHQLDQLDYVPANFDIIRGSLVLLETANKIVNI